MTKNCYSPIVAGIHKAFEALSAICRGELKKNVNLQECQFRWRPAEKKAFFPFLYIRLSNLRMLGIQLT
jgi:hypothetical protein